MKLTNKDKAKQITKKRKKSGKIAYTMTELEQEIADAFLEDMNKFHGNRPDNDRELDRKLLIDELGQLSAPITGKWDESLKTFSPSSASKCDRELSFKILGFEPDETSFEPYQQRWVRNGSAVHRAFQQDLAYLELQDYARFEVLRTDKDKYAWERNVRKVRTFEHKGVKFQLYGMTDGFLTYKPRDLRVGIDLKTKSTTIAAVGDYLLKTPPQNNVEQMVAYSLMFDVDHFLIPYESLAKDAWNKGKEARSDMKVFCLTITDEMKTKLLDKFANIVKETDDGSLGAPDFEKCLFCKHKTACALLEKEFDSLGN